jgi:hypothetical protein
MRYLDYVDAVIALLEADEDKIPIYHNSIENLLADAVVDSELFALTLDASDETYIEDEGICEASYSFSLSVYVEQKNPMARALELVELARTLIKQGEVGNHALVYQGFDRGDTETQSTAHYKIKFQLNITEAS